MQKLEESKYEEVSWDARTTAVEEKSTNGWQMGRCTSAPRRSLHGHCFRLSSCHPGAVLEASELCGFVPYCIREKRYKEAGLCSQGGYEGIPKESAKKRPASSSRLAGRGKGKGAASKAREDSISLLSDGEEVEKGPSEDEVEEVPHVDRGKLRGILKKTKERILGGGAGPSQALDARGARHGRSAEPSDSAPPRGLVAGTALNPSRQMATQLVASADTRGDGTRHWMKKLAGRSDAASTLLAQAVQTSEREARQRRGKKKSKEKENPVQQLVNLLKGKKKKRKRKDSSGGAQKRNKRVSWAVKPDPEDPDDSGGSGSSSSELDGSRDDRNKSDDESELSYEPPLRKRALREPGSVMEMLVKHAQLQLDQGALLETEGAHPSLTSGVKISTYFAVLIRPYHMGIAPIAGAVRLGPGDRLAPHGEIAGDGRRTGVEIHSSPHSPFRRVVDDCVAAGALPLEPIQSASTATMLEAHKHRRLVMKSQGYSPSQTWWPSTGRGKGIGAGGKGRREMPRDGADGARARARRTQDGRETKGMRLRGRRAKRIRPRNEGGGRRCFTEFTAAGRS